MVVNRSNMYTFPPSIVAAKLKNIDRCLKNIESEPNAVNVWLKDNFEVFNPNKTKVMVISKQITAQYHQLKNSNKVNIKWNNDLQQCNDFLQLFFVNGQESILRLPKYHFNVARKLYC